jgi:hypothetical protein
VYFKRKADDDYLDNGVCVCVVEDGGVLCPACREEEEDAATLFDIILIL